MGLLHDTQVQKSPVSFSFLAPIYQAWKEIPSIVFEDLSAIWGPTDQRVSCTIQRSGALFSRTPWALLRDSLSVILVPRDSGTTESRLGPRVFTPHPCEQSWAPPTTTLIPRRLLRLPPYCSILALLTPPLQLKITVSRPFLSKTTQVTSSVHSPMGLSIRPLYLQSHLGRRESSALQKHKVSSFLE